MKLKISNFKFQIGLLLTICNLQSAICNAATPLGTATNPPEVRSGIQLTILTGATLRAGAGAIVDFTDATVIGLDLGAGTVTSINLVAPAAGITVSGGPITSNGSITLSLANDLGAIEALSGTGFAKRTGTDTWTLDTNSYTIANSAITGATKTKVTYDSKGLVTAGADATTADIPDSTNKRYVTDAQQTILGNTSGTNTGDQNLFSSLAVSGQGNVVADAAGDTLTLVAGTNVTITTNAATDTVTINAIGDGTGTVQSINLTAPAAGITVSGGPITTTGSITLLLANDLSALEALSGTGFAKRTGADTWTLDTNTYTVANGAITPATKTKVTYDAKGLVTAGADATTADIPDSTNKRYVTDAQQTVIANTSGTNTGDQTSVTGNAGTATALANPRTINGVSFNGTANITVTAAGSTLSDTVTVGKGGTGLTTLGSALQVLRVNAGATALEYASPGGGGDALVANPLSQFAATTSAQLGGVLSDESGTSGGFLRSGGGAVSGLTGLGIRSTGAAFDLTIASSEVFTAGRTLTINMGDAARTLTFAGNATISGTNTGDQTSVTGNAGTATAWATGRTLSITGDLTYTSPSFDGTGNVTAAGTIANDAVTLAKMANMATASFLGRNTAATGDPEVLSISTAKTMLNLTGTNSGDQVIPSNTTATSNQFFTAYNNTTGAFTKAQALFTGLDFTSGDLTTILGTSAVRGTDKIVWIKKRTDSKSGVGTEEDPYDGSTQTLLDAVAANSSKCPANAEIHVAAPGATLVTKGLTVRSGQKWYISPGTTLQLGVLSSGEAAALNAGGIAILGGNTSGQALIEDVLVYAVGATFDMNLAAQSQQLRPGAVGLCVDGLTVTGGRYIDWGTTATGGECFVIAASSNGTRDGRIHRKGVLVEDTEFTQPASVTHVYGISLINPNGAANVVTSGSLSNGWFEGVTVRNNYIHDINFASAVDLACINIGGWVKGWHGHHNRIENVVGTNARMGYYIDTGSFIDVTLENDQIINVASGMRILGNAGYVYSGLTIRNELIDSCSYSGIALESVSTTSSNFTVADNTLLNCGSFGIEWDNVQGIRFRNNIIDKSSSQISSSSPGVIWEQFNNTKLDGTIIASDFFSDADKGDITTSSAFATWTIDNGAVSLAKMANMATASLLGRNTAGTGVPEVLSASTVRSLLSLVVGTNVQAWDADLDAIAALSGTNTIYYRSGAGTWTAVTIGTGLNFTSGTLTAPGGGSGTVTSASVVTANGVSASVATATTTPAFTFTLGAITPASVALPTTTSTTGLILVNSIRFLHAYGDAANLFAGSGAGNFTNSGATANTGIGSGALVALTSGDENVAIGANAGEVISSGSKNIYIGRYAGSSSNSASGNVGIGDQALLQNTTGSYNTVIGRNALPVFTGSGNSFMVAVGQGTGDGTVGVANNTGSLCTLLGNYANTAASNSTRAIAIGYQAVAASNEAAIGGSGADAVDLKAYGLLKIGSTPTTLTDAAGKILSASLNTVGAVQGGTGVANNAASTLTISGNFGVTFTISGTTGLTLPTSGTLATLAGTEAFSNKTISSSNNTLKPTESMIIAVGDETTAITTGTAKVTFRMPYAFTVTKVKASLTVVSTSGLPTVDINEAGTTIISTKITIDANELTSETAATPSVISDSSLADDAEMTIDIDTAGTGAKGLKVTLIGYRT